MDNELKRRLGLWGEALAANYLYRQGYTVLRHHYAVRGGEIDLLARRGDTLAVVEVKLGSGHWYAPGEAVNQQKQRRICRAMDAYVKEHPECLQQSIRFDVCQITAPQGCHTPDPVIDYFENAFYYIPR